MRNELRILLDELGRAVDAAHPGWSAGWQPGLSRARIDALLEPLEGWRPPAEIIALYEWRNGQAGEDEQAIWPPFSVLPLEQAVSLFKQLHDALPGMPPLFAFGYGSKTNLEVPLSREPRESEPLYHRDNEGQPFLAFTGLEGLLRAAIDGFREGLFRWNEEYRLWESEEAAERVHAARLRHNPGTSPTLWYEENEECGREWINQFDASTWPAQWQPYIGFDPEGFKPLGASASIEDVVLGRVDWARPVIVESVIEGLVGSGRETRVRLTDGIQSMEVICEGVHASGIVVGDRFEFELERPLTKEEHAARRQEDEETDKAVREQMRQMLDLLAANTGSKRSGDLDAADFLSSRSGSPDMPIYIARRVALVERDPGADESNEEGDPHVWDQPDPPPPAQSVRQLAKDLLGSYRNGYRIEHEFKAVDLDDIEDIDMELYERIDAAMRKEGFRILGAYEIANIRDIWPNFPRIAMRSYSDCEATMCAFYSLSRAMWASMMPPRKPPRDGIVDLLTQFSDGRVILTTSAGDALKYEAPPHVERELMPVGSTLAEVLKRHRARVGAAKGQPIAAKTMKEYLALLRGRHQREREFALNRIPTVAELIRLGTNPDLAQRVHEAMRDS